MGPGIESRWGRDSPHLSRPGPGAHTASRTMGIGCFPAVKSGRGVTLTLHPLLVPWSRQSRAISLLPLWAVGPVQSLSASTGEHFKKNGNYIRCETCRHFKKKKEEYLRDKINEHKANSKDHSITDIHHKFNPLNAELNPICCLLALLGAHHFLHVSRIRVNSLTLRLLIYIYIYIYGAPILDVSR